MNKTLYTSKEVRGAIDQIFDDKDSRRVAVVAYLGVNAGKYLKPPKGMEIVCCPEPGATSPNAIRELFDKGADVKFSKQLHAKVYWSDRGCVITSANLSDNALGEASKQKEAGILIDSKDVDIDRLLKKVKPYNVNRKDMNKLYKGIRIPIIREVEPGRQDVNATFISWFESSSLCREEWKIGWWNADDGDIAESAKVISLWEYEVKDPDNFMCFAKNQVQKGECMLCFKITESGGIDDLVWMFVDFVVPVDKTDKGYDKDYPYQAIQVRESKHYSLPPFKIDPKFKKAFKKAVKEYGTDKIEGRLDLKPSKKLLEYVKKHITV